MRRTKWAEKSLLGTLWDYAIDVSEAFQTVSIRDSVNRPFGFASHGDDNFSSSVSFFQITDGLGDLA